MSRGWTMINGEDSCEDEIKSNAKKEMIIDLVKKWNKINSKIERRSLLSEVYEEYSECGCDEHECQCVSQDDKDIAKLQVIEETLESLGARLMRPYEHHNEDERYMEYMENRYN